MKERQEIPEALDTPLCWRIREEQEVGIPSKEKSMIVEKIFRVFVL